MNPHELTEQERDLMRAAFASATRTLVSAFEGAAVALGAAIAAFAQSLAVDTGTKKGGA